MSVPSQRPPPSPPLQDRLLGTLIVIVLRAKNLPNRVRIGKQNPYATVTYGLHKKRTETIERGGQQPTWDAEFRFEILKEEFENEQLEAGGAAHVDRKGGVLPMSTKDSASGTGNRLEKPKPTVTVGDGRRVLKLACWADDNRDPRLIGEGELNIEETIRKGKFDDWVKLERKERYAGEVYLELTWYSNGPKPAASLNRPERSDSPTRGTYGGAGARLNDHDEEEDVESPNSDGRDATDLRSVNHRHSQANLEPTHASLTLAPDYPDSDLAPLSANHYPDSDLDPLTRSMSALSVGRPLPQPPSLVSVAPQYAPQVSHSQTYSHLPNPSDGYGYDRDRRTSFHSLGPSGGYPNQTQEQYAPPAQHQYQQPTYADYAPAPPNEFGTYADQAQGQYNPAAPPPQPPLGEFEQLAHQHYASQVYEQSSVSSQRPLPQPGAPSTQQYWNAHYTHSHPPPPAASTPYPPPVPQPPVPPIPPSTSVYWQKQQLQQQQQQQRQSQHSSPPDFPSSATYPNLPSSMSYQQLSHSVSHATMHPSPSTPSFAPPPSTYAVHPPPPPPSSLSHSYSTPPHPGSYAPSFAPPPAFSPPPPPPSLQGGYPTHSAPPALYPSYQPPQPVYDPNPNYDPSPNGRPPLPPPPPPVHPSLHQQQQQYGTC